MRPRATNSENWLPQSQLIVAIATARETRAGGSEIHERVAQLFVVVHTLSSLAILLAVYESSCLCDMNTLIIEPLQSKASGCPKSTYKFCPILLLL